MLTFDTMAPALYLVQQCWTSRMKAHQLFSFQLKTRGAKSDSFSGKWRLFQKTLKMKVKVGDFQFLERVYIKYSYIYTVKNNFNLTPDIKISSLFL